MNKNELKTGMTLANRWRPKTWDDVCGHTNIVTRMKGMLANFELPNAILLSGPSGTGKTTLSRVFARYINCENGNSCGKCDSCKMMDNNTHPDYQEVDAGSSGGVDGVRSLINQANFMPTMGNIRIIMVDEAQALTGSAQTAFLKTLEEPPEHTLFILATMQVEKISPAILGRCQRMDLKRILPEYLADHLAAVAKSEKMKLPKDVFERIANATGGQVRDALQALDAVNQAACGAGDDDDLDEIISDAVLNATDIADETNATKVLKAVYENESPKTLKSVIKAIMDVQNAISFSNALLWQNNYLISVNADPKTDKVYHTPVNLKAKEAVGKVDLGELLLVQSHLLSLRRDLVQVTGQETALMQTHLSDAWYSVFDNRDG